VDVDSSLSQLEQYPWRRAAKVALLYALVYALADFALNRFAFYDGWTILWPLNGVTIALLIMRPRSEWPPILCGVVVGTGFGERFDNNGFSLVAWQRAISLVEVILSASLLPPFSSLNSWLRKPYVFRKFIAALVIGPGVSGILAALYFHHIQQQSYLRAFNNWATADALGIAATMPLVLSLRSPEMRSLFTREAWPKTIAILALALVSADLALSVSRYPLLFLLYPVLLLVDSLLTFAASALAMCVVCFLAVYLAINHHGPFGVWSHQLPVSRDVALQLYLGFHVFALFPASIRILERKRIGEELRDANVQLTMLASLDGLTGIANRRAFDERFAREWNRSLRTGAPLSLLMIDIDHFKQFNDRYGHHAGDRALTKVATALAAQLQRPADLVARFGGEEFAVLLPQTDLAGAAHMAETLRRAIADLAILHQGSSWDFVTVSIGGAARDHLQPGFGSDRFPLLTAADQALYQAKRSGRNCVQLHCEMPAVVGETV
jgi:diguanylate cyclase (GGDEF)-like protein